jgi:hypothetical protein
MKCSATTGLSLGKHNISFSHWSATVLSYQLEAGRLAHELEQWIKKMKCSGTTGLSMIKHNIPYSHWSATVLNYQSEAGRLARELEQW